MWRLMPGRSSSGSPNLERNIKMTRSRLSMAIVAMLLVAPMGTALGAHNGDGLLGPTHTGQPNASCETTPNTPGNSASAPGSAFNPDGIAGTKYAGTQPQNSKNTASVSQYDVACAHQPN